MNARNSLVCFKSYDVRGKIGKDLNEDIAYRIGRAIAHSLEVKTVVLGFDARATSQSLAIATANGICDEGADVLEIGLAGTEEVYSAVASLKSDAGIEITASHNPIDYNGMKIVKKNSKPLSNQEFLKIKHLAEENSFHQSKYPGSIIDKKIVARRAYIDKILEFVELKNLKPLKIVINSGNGAAGPTVDALSAGLKKMGVRKNFFLIHHEPDASFPNGIPNPLLRENRSVTSDAVIQKKADFGVAFDGDFDRCFLFDNKGNFIPGEYVVGLLAQVFLRREKGASIVHDPRVIWNTIDVVDKSHGHAVKTKTGHAFVKASMRKAGAIYGGEMSAHHYFRDFSFCDSGMIPWLMIWQLLSETNVSLSELICDRKNSFPSSGELNFTVVDSADCLEVVKSFYASDAVSTDEFDGLSMCFENWRFNLRKSNTEPFVRLNIETKGNQALLQNKISEMKKIINTV